jgi:hypothetical protein
MKICVALLICGIVLGAGASAEAQSDAQDKEQSKWDVHEVDASVHAEVDGRPPEPSVAESPVKSLSPLHSAKRPPATVVWPARADASNRSSAGKSSVSAARISSFRPETGSGESPAATAAATDKNDNSGRGRARLSHAQQDVHPLRGSVTPPSSLSAVVPTISESDSTQGFSASFGRAFPGFIGSTDAFQECRISSPKGTPVKRNRQRSRQSKSRTKSSTDALASP